MAMPPSIETQQQEVSGEDDNETYSFASQLVLGTCLPMALQRACELGILEIIAKAGPGAKLSATDIAAQLPTKSQGAPIMVDRIARLLASHNWLCCSVMFDYLMDFICRCQLKYAVLEGGFTFNWVHGAHAFDYPGLNARFYQVFNIAMLNLSTMFTKKLLHHYDGFHVIQHAPSYSGIEHVASDMFVNVPHRDAIFLKLVLHDWSDEKCLRLLNNCHKAIPNNGKVIVVDSVVLVMAESTPSAKATFLLNMLMMTQSPGGKERKREEFVALATKAGFNNVKFECFDYDRWVIEFHK
ncbi:hypothetical protein GOBAR_AA16812 [Gossypium barbadense]|uniref:O-methyltransferase domain-containing protein n=1 Tax=Gossypium barbadense TaxID=3634 RepID=A0A2P5XKI9_GOSBA|nr:hypothetical protein GOBAR_AA16812 [Gossypium barbadense]